MSALFNTQEAVLLVPQSADYIVIDIETTDAPDEAIQAAIEAWKPPSNIKDQAKIESRRVEAYEKAKEKAALLDASPIICVSVIHNGKTIVFSSMGKCNKIVGLTIDEATSESSMLSSLSYWLAQNTSRDTTIVGHNIRNFDLPKLRNAYVRNGLSLPEILKPRFDGTSQPMVDTASLFKSFSMEHRDDFCPSLDSVCRSFGIPRPKTLVSGADVPDLHKQGRFEEIITYCAIDTAATNTAYKLMAGIN